MNANDGDLFDFLAPDTAISVECDGIDYVFSSRVVGRLKQWLVITYDPAMEGFHDQIKPGSRLEIRFLRHGTYNRMEVFLKRMVSGGAKALVIDRPSKVEMIERRLQPRRDCDLKALMEVRRQAEVTIININAKGCRLRMPCGTGDQPMMRKQDRVLLAITLPGEGRKVSMTGEIRNLVGTREHVEAGILFDGSSSELTGILKSITSPWRTRRIPASRCGVRSAFCLWTTNLSRRIW